MRKPIIHEMPKVKTHICKIKSFAGLQGEVSDDTVGLGFTKYACNLRLFGGEISHTFGVDVGKINNYLLPSSAVQGSLIKKVINYKKHDYIENTTTDKLIYHLVNGKIYCADVGGDNALTYIGIPEATEVEMINYHYQNKDVLLVFDNEGHVTTYDGENVTSESGRPAIKSACVYNERVYGVVNGSENKVRCSGRLNPFEWADTTAGAMTINFPEEGGVLRRVVVCGDSLYIFRDYAVYRLTGYKEINDYNLTRIFFTHNQIYDKTVGIWNEKIYFLSEDGFYSIKGSSVSKEWRDEFSLIEDKKNASGVCYGGVYYVSAKLYTDGGTVGDEAHCTHNNGILGMMIGNQGVSIVRGADVMEFVPCFTNGKSHLLLVNTLGYRSMNLSILTEDGMIYGMYPEKRWRSPSVTLGERGLDKVVRAIHIRTLYDLTLKVILDKEYSFTIKGSPKTQTIPINGRGERVQIYISSNASKLRLEGFDIEYETLERRKYGAN